MGVTIILVIIACALFISGRWLKNDDIARIANIATIILFLLSVIPLISSTITPNDDPQVTTPTSQKNTPPQDQLITGNLRDFLPHQDQYPEYLQLVADKSFSNLDLTEYRDDPDEVIKTLESVGRVISHIHELHSYDECETEEAIAKVLLQVIMMSDQQSAKDYLHGWQVAEGAEKISTATIGEETNVYFYPADDSNNWHCENLIGIEFRYKYRNLIVGVYVDGFQDRITEDKLLSEAIKYAKIIELNLSSLDN